VLGGPGDQGTENHGGGTCVVERSVSGCHVESQLLNQPGKTRRLTFRQVEDETRQGRGVDDRMLERALEPAPDQPRVEGVVAVLHQDRALRKPQECTAGVLELRCADEHRTIDVVAPARVGVDRGAAIHQGVEEGKWAVETEALGADLQDQERRVACRLYVEGDELSLVEACLETHLGSVDRDLLPRNRVLGAAWLEEYRPGGIHLTSARARRAKAISSAVTALIASAVTP
jgi:hypothetical protein